MKRAIFLFFICITFQNVLAQIGGRGVFQSMNLPPSARTAALGGSQIAVLDNELTLGFQNPALLNPLMHKQITFNQVNYLADINFGYAGYDFSLDSLTTILGGVQYISYGDFTKADEFGNINGTFTGNEFSVVMGIG